MYLHFPMSFGPQRQVSLYRCLVTTVESSKKDDSIKENSPERVSYTWVKVEHPRPKVKIYKFNNSSLNVWLDLHLFACIRILLSMTIARFLRNRTKISNWLLPQIIFNDCCQKSIVFGDNVSVWIYYIVSKDESNIWNCLWHRNRNHVILEWVVFSYMRE